MNMGEDDRMGFNEEVFIVRDGYPIGYIEYRGCPVTTKLEKKDVEELDRHLVQKEFSAKLNGDEFIKILETFSDKDIEPIEQYVKDYFKKIGVKKTDLVYVMMG
ncbi:MAG: hypothetical protein HeimC3_31690 [Candidatus Heimdallarchaeota archaeon LC_3]|nr:MAG: hypothetical protein HeimC3_31690 [Candidatus Heimdallarchaeota archaeon LC_3]